MAPPHAATAGMIAANDIDSFQASMALLRTRERAVRDLAARARRGDLEAMRLLHFGEYPWQKLEDYEYGYWIIAAVEFRRIEYGRNPPARHPGVPPGSLDFFRLHALALDRLDELLAFILPEGHEGPTASGRWVWFGHHPQRPELVTVCLLTGAWSEPNAGCGGRDLVSLYGHVFGVSPGRAYHMMAEFLDVDAVAYA